MTEWSNYHTGVSKPTTIRGVTYPSRWAAAKALNCTPSNIYKAAQEGWLDRVGLKPHRWREEMAKWGIPEGRKPLTDADMAELTRRLADTAIEQSELYKAAKRDAEKAEAYAAELEAVIARLTALLQKQSTLMDMGFAEYERRLATARRDALDDAAQTVESLWACRTCAEVAEAVRALITKEEPTT